MTNLQDLKALSKRVQFRGQQQPAQASAANGTHQHRHLLADQPLDGDLTGSATDTLHTEPELKVAQQQMQQQQAEQLGTASQQVQQLPQQADQQQASDAETQSQTQQQPQLQQQQQPTDTQAQKDTMQQSQQQAAQQQATDHPGADAVGKPETA